MGRTATSLTKLGAGFGLMFFNGFALWKMWEWFVAPLGAPTITYWHALGLYTIVLLLTARLSRTTLDASLDLGDYFKAQFVKLYVIGMLLGIAYLISGQI